MKDFFADFRGAAQEILEEVGLRGAIAAPLKDAEKSIFSNSGIGSQANHYKKIPKDEQIEKLIGLGALLAILGEQLMK